MCHRFRTGLPEAMTQELPRDCILICDVPQKRGHHSSNCYRLSGHHSENLNSQKILVSDILKLALLPTFRVVACICIHFSEGCRLSWHIFRHSIYFLCVKHRGLRFCCKRIGNSDGRNKEQEQELELELNDVAVGLLKITVV